MCWSYEQAELVIEEFGLQIKDWSKEEMIWEISFEAGQLCGFGRQNFSRAEREEVIDTFVYLERDRYADKALEDSHRSEYYPFKIKVDTYGNHNKQSGIKYVKHLKITKEGDRFLEEFDNICSWDDTIRDMRLVFLRHVLKEVKGRDQMESDDERKAHYYTINELMARSFWREIIETAESLGLVTNRRLTDES